MLLNLYIIAVALVSGSFPFLWPENVSSSVDVLTKSRKISHMFSNMFFSKDVFQLNFSQNDETIGWTSFGADVSSVWF